MASTSTKKVTGGSYTTTATTSISTTDFTGVEVTLTTCATEARIDSRLLAHGLLNQHKAVLTLLDRYVDVFKHHGQLTFKKEVGERKQGGGNAERYALLNEDQAYLLLNLSRNTKVVVSLKSKLIAAFGEARRAADMRRTEYLPSYHYLQDSIHAVSATSSNEGRVHMNVAKLINKTVGLQAGQRAAAAIPQQAMLIVAQTVAARAMQSGVDHHDGYQRVKQSLLAFSACTMLEGV
jgi:phage regulator Rha-like protein